MKSKKTTLQESLRDKTKDIKKKYLLAMHDNNSDECVLIHSTEWLEIADIKLLHKWLGFVIKYQKFKKKAKLKRDKYVT